jgi:hypothetical protein
MAEKTYKHIPAPGADEYTMVPVEIEKTEEQWTRVFLSDGTTLKIRPVVAKAGRSIDRPVPNSGGEPVYHVQVHVMVVADVAESVRFKTDDEK